MEKKYYIAYGSNLNVEQMRWRCPGATITGTALIPDYRLLFRGSKTGSYLTIEPAAGFNVPAAIWAVTDADECSLDRYEGYPTFYYKQEMELDIIGIRTGKHRRRKAFVYIMHEDRPIGIPTRTYMSTCWNGYDRFGFDPDYLLTALKYSLEEA